MADYQFIYVFFPMLILYSISGHGQPPAAAADRAGRLRLRVAAHALPPAHLTDEQRVPKSREEREDIPGRDDDVISRETEGGRYLIWHPCNSGADGSSPASGPSVDQLPPADSSTLPPSASDQLAASLETETLLRIAFKQSHTQTTTCTE